MEAKWLKLNLNLAVGSHIKWLWHQCVQSFLSFSPLLSLFAPSPPPGCFITPVFSSQSGKVHFHREGLTSHVITKPSVRLINSTSIKNAGPVRSSVSKNGRWGWVERDAAAAAQQIQTINVHHPLAERRGIDRQNSHKLQQSTFYIELMMPYNKWTHTF